MDIHEEEEIKKEFQLERVVLFSDAVFAIIITIMVLEMKVPEGLRHADGERLKEVFLHLLPKFGGYILSFFIVGAFWLKHLKLFSYLKDYTVALIVHNLVFLFFISLFPFAVSIMTETISPRNLNGLYIYFSITMFALLSQTMLAGYLVRNAAQLCINPHDIEKNLQWKAHRLTFIAVPLLLIYMVVAFIVDIPPQTFSYVFIIWAALLAFVRKKYYPNTQKADKRPVLVRLFTKKAGRIKHSHKPIETKPE